MTNWPRVSSCLAYNATDRKSPVVKISHTLKALMTWHTEGSVVLDDVFHCCCVFC